MNEWKAQRKRLFHDVPSWVDLDETVFFITVCCAARNKNTLCDNHVARVIFESVEERIRRRVWYAHLVVVMPDHLHMLTSFDLRRYRMGVVIKAWKSWLHKQQGIRWQYGFFDHRLRREESRQEKADYILENPVRKGLVGRWEEWPYVWFPDG